MEIYYPEVPVKAITLETVLKSLKNFPFEDEDVELIEKLVENKLGIDPYFECLTEELVKKLHDKGIEINCWTVNEVENVMLLDKWGVDMITSNFIE